MSAKQKQTRGNQKLNSLIGSHSIPPVILLVSIILIYWKIYNYPYVQDDWYTVSAIMKSGSGRFLIDSVFNFSELFFRPLGLAYLLLAHNLFGFNSWGFHTIALALLFLNALLVKRIAVRVASNQSIGWMSGFVYAGAVTVHIDTLGWAVGIYDLGGMSFVLLCCLFFLQDHILLSLLMLCLGLLTKESTIVTPFILCALAMSTKVEGSALNLRMLLRRVGPAFVVMLLYLGARFSIVASKATLGATPYSIELFGPTIIENFLRYCSWLMDSVAPIIADNRSPWILVVIIVLGYFVVRNSAPQKRLALGLGIWMICGILPALGLQDHAFRYYLVYALPAFAIFVSSVINTLISSIKLNRAFMVGILGTIVALNAAISAYYVSSLDQEGFDSRQIGGSNNLLRKGRMVNLTKAFLLKNRTSIPRGSTLLFDWLPTNSFGVRIGPGIWLEDTTINIYEVMRDSSGIHLVDPSRPGLAVPLQPVDNEFILPFHGKELEIHSLSD